MIEQINCYRVTYRSLLKKLGVVEVSFIVVTENEDKAKVLTTFDDIDDTLGNNMTVSCEPMFQGYIQVKKDG